MINLLVNSITPRHEYIFKVIFEIILKTDYKIKELPFPVSEINDIDNEDACISYGVKTNSLSLSIPDSCLLTEKNIREHHPDITLNGFPKLFCQSGMYNIDFDPFSASFYLVTEYEKYLTPVFDKHGRYKEDYYETFRQKLYEWPLVNIYAEFLWEKLKNMFPGLKREKALFDYEITIDVDEPWAYLNKDMLTYAGYIKDMLTGNRQNFEDRKKAIKTGIDPFNSFSELLEFNDPANTIFFFLLNGRSNFDSRFTSKNRQYSRLIKEISSRGYRIGIHPSYFSYINKKMIFKQKSALQKITGKNIVFSRQHYLKYRLPETYNYLLDAGIRHDYTSSLVSTAGFRNCIANPFPWFNLEENRFTELIIHPSMAMDATFIKYLKYVPEKAFEDISKLIDKTHDVNGKFVLIWHNSNFINHQGMTGWKAIFRKTLEYLKEKSLMHEMG